MCSGARGPAALEHSAAFTTRVPPSAEEGETSLLVLLGREQGPLEEMAL